MGGSIGDIFSAPIDIFTDPVGFFEGQVDIVKEAASQIKDDLEIVSQYLADNAYAFVNPVGDYLIKNFDLPDNGGLLGMESMASKGIAYNHYNVMMGTMEGDWVRTRDGIVGIVNSLVAIVAIVLGIFGSPWTGGTSWALVAAGVAMLDAQYNNGALLGTHIQYSGKIEEATLGTTYTQQYAQEIQMLITLVATIYASSMVFTGISEFFNIPAITAGWQTELSLMQAGYGGYQIYSAVQAILDSQAYWKARLEEAEAYYRKLLQQILQANETWFDMMTNPDMINRVMAGGNLFSMGAGHPLWSQTSVAEPRYSLGLIDRSDRDMDSLIGNRAYMYSAGSDGFKPQ